MEDKASKNRGDKRKTVAVTSAVKERVVDTVSPVRRGERELGLGSEGGGGTKKQTGARSRGRDLAQEQRRQEGRSRTLVASPELSWMEW